MNNTTQIVWAVKEWWSAGQPSPEPAVQVIDEVMEIYHNEFFIPFPHRAFQKGRPKAKQTPSPVLVKYSH
jgi:hypothetical protein